MDLVPGQSRWGRRLKFKFFPKPSKLEELAIFHITFSTWEKNMYFKNFSEFSHK